MDLIIQRLFLLFCLSIIPLPTFAGDFDGSKPLSGSVNKIIEINPEITPLTGDISDYLIKGSAGEVMNRILAQMEAMG